MGLRCQEIHLLASQVTHLRWELADSRVEHEKQLQVRFVMGTLFHFDFSSWSLLTSFVGCSRDS